MVASLLIAFVRVENSLASVYVPEIMLNKFIKTKIIFTTNSTANTVGEFAPRRSYAKYTSADLVFPS